MFCSIYLQFSLVKLQLPLISLMDFSNEYLLFMSVIPYRKKKKESYSMDFTVMWCTLNGVHVAMGEGESRRWKLFPLNYKWFEIQSVISDWQNIENSKWRMCGCTYQEKCWLLIWNFFPATLPTISLRYSWYTWKAAHVWCIVWWIWQICMLWALHTHINITTIKVINIFIILQSLLRPFLLLRTLKMSSIPLTKF